MEEIIGAVPEQQDIDRLLSNPKLAASFDAKYGAGASIKYLPPEPEVVEEPQPQPEKDSGFMSEVVQGGKIGIKEGFRETLETINNLIKDAPNLTLSDFLTGFSAADAIAAKNPDEVQSGEDTILQDIADAIPESDEPDTLTEGISRGISQFGFSFLGGSKALKTLGWANNASKGLNLTRSFVVGGLVDFAAFDEHEARFTDFLVEQFPELSDTWVNYLAADPNDTWWEGKWKNTVEGAGLGGILGTTLWLVGKGFKAVKPARIAGDPEAATKAYNTHADEMESTLGRQTDEVVEETDEVVDEVVDDVADEVVDTTTTATTRAVDEVAPRPNAKPKSTKAKVRDTEVERFNQQLKSNLQAYAKGELDFEDAIDVDINLNNIDSVNLEDTKIVAQNIYDTVKSTIDEFDDVKSHDQIWKEVDDFLDNEVDTINTAVNLNKQLTKGDSLRTTMRILFNTYSKQVIKNSKRYQNNEISFDEAKKTLEVAATILNTWKGLGKKAARILNAGNIVIKDEADYMKNFNRLLDEFNFRPEDAEKILNKAAKIDTNKPHSFKRFMKDVVTGKALGIEKVNKYWINALLSNPKTHAINITSNTIMALIRPIEQIAGGALTLNKESVMEGIHTAVGLIKYFQEAMYLANRSFRKNDAILDTNTKLDTQFKRSNNRVGKAIETPTRLLTAEDEFFKQLNYRAKVYAKIVNEAVRKGISNKKINTLPNGKKYSDFDKYIEDRFEEAFRPNGEASSQFLDAKLYAQENTFTKQLGKSLGGSVQNAVNTVPVLRQIIPFVRTPVNIARAVLDRTPGLALATKRFRDELFSPDPTIRAAARGKQLIGGALFTTALVLANSGAITGGIDKNRTVNRQKFDSGWRPYSIKIGDNYYSYERLDPFGMFLGLVADYAEIAEDLADVDRDTLAEANLVSLIKHIDITDYPAFAGAGFISTTKNIASKTYVKSLTDFLEALSSGDMKEWERYGKQKVASFIPSVVSGVMNDQLYRETRDLTTTLKNKSGIFGFGDPSFNALGEVRLKQQNDFDSLINPITKTIAVDDVVVNEFVRLNQGFEAISQNIGSRNNIDLTEYKLPDGTNAFVKYNQLVNEGNLRKQLEKLIKSPSYQKLTDNPSNDDLSYGGSKVYAIQKVIKAYRKQALAKLLKLDLKSENGITLKQAYVNDKRNIYRARKGLEFLELK
jgi:hypothetical protein